MRQESKLAEIDAEDWNLAQAARGAHDHAVTAEDDLQVGVARLLGVRIALTQPSLHTLTKLDRFRFGGIGDDAEASGFAIERLSLARLNHRGRLCQLEVAQQFDHLAAHFDLGGWN
jgi:hypothetical protein